MKTKFRAWDNVKDCMYYLGEDENVVFAFVSSGIIATDITEGEDEFSLLHHLQYMQYTGLNDSEGTEIYEGDLLSIQIVRDAKKTVTIVFEDGAFGVKDELFGWGYGKEFYPLKTIINNHKVEIVGNIYQNKELLEGE